jgi:mRNA interferase RelE/StbE
VLRAEIPPHVAEIVRHLSPDVKRGVREAIRSLLAKPELGELLSGELAGFRRVRVRRYRIVYEVRRSGRTVRIHAVGHRRTVYEELVEQARRIRGRR